ncbi:DegT/DnrJ/EryC1/StrS family aminotransferase [Yeosuana sp. MJ-SS3]|uniref:DegT/DnrJ/EryC1/StrS family aminotransferase n=1 Tax=Gilvirhabdus luticola TaxID=3079858 RepID=A0ABU3U4Z7_9FLAO|nr:DegT/DnrJ/EryC1/StrS family aminotransferase [Yeosuana sp. MJ-SS3]MDU8885485.1 DegT/DnrJ/EryC1/StrS family aminotransferase [Yeosuana sp. MJ-SS3]
MINVTKTFLPDQSEYQAILRQAWDTGWITNRGALVQELEEKLKTHLVVPNIILTTNGTLPLQIAIKALELKGDIITTAFSYVATTSSIVWEGCKPVFVDIHPDYLTIDESKIEAAITSETTAILVTHVFGNPCDVEAIDTIAKKHNLKVIYDAAHCFGVTYKEQSIFNYGDVSTCSFHATKLFHTGEGGALFTNSETLSSSLFSHHNFGHHGQEHFQGLGINAKMSELQAAMGLAVLPYINLILEARKELVAYYKDNLKLLPTIKIRPETSWNYGYYPVIFSDESQLLKIKSALNAEHIFPRRYFYPSLNTLPYVKHIDCPITDGVAPAILCLPLYYGLSHEKIKRICTIIRAQL